MTHEKQTGARHLGRRSLSVVLSVLMLLSTFAVMMTATSLSASAAISYWFVDGDFDGWTHNVSGTNKINGASGSVTIDIAGSSRDSIDFKMVAVENGNKIWCSAAQTLSSGTEYEMSWGGDNDNMKYLLYSDTTQVTFQLIVKNDKNYIKVTQNGTGSGGGGEGGDSGQSTYSAPVNKDNDDNLASNLFWANATYYDYLSDTELSNTKWLKPIQAGTKNFGGANDEWYPFYQFNRSVVKSQADSQSNWSTPLYFGNFCDTNGAYDTPHHQNGYDTDGYREATNSYNVTRFVHAANNSDHSVKNPGSYVHDMKTSYQGLVNSSLSSDGDLLLPNGQTAPYFDAGTLGNYAKVVNSSFPFKVTPVEGKDYKRYTFNSKDATDNVYFTWASSGGETYPTGVNYGAGSTYGVRDGISRFMNGGTSGFGIFPFNNASNNNKGVKTYANENLNYGFGIKTQVKFRVPKPDEEKGVNTEDDPIYFDFTGDDDLWMYITDEKGNSQLVLDMGGAHKESHGRVNFNTLQAKVDKVGASGNAVTKDFTFDYSQTYTMTVFYMERGLIESNCKMEFTMTPLGNNFIVTEAIDTVDVNDGIESVVKELSTFGFRPFNNNTQVTDDGYGDFELGDSENISIPDTVLGVRSNVKIQQYAPANSYLVYDTRWDYYNNVNGKFLGSGTGVTSNGVTTITEEKELIAPSGDEYDFAELQVNYVNTPQLDSINITKTVNDPGVDHSSETFPATVYLQFKKTPESGSVDQYSQPYAYDLETSDGYKSNGRITLQANKTITIPNLPVGTRVTVVEDQNPNYTVQYSGTAIVGTNDVLTVTNTPVNPDKITGEVEGYKYLDDELYSGELFRFVMEGVGSLSGDAANVVDTSDMPDMVSESVVNGRFSFATLYFDKPGVYRYHVYEDMTKLEEKDNAADTSAETSYASDISGGGEFLVKFTVTREIISGRPTLVKNGPVYIPYSGEEHTMTAADFDKTGGSVMTFYNYVQKGSVKIVKTNQSNLKLNGVTFGLYAITDSFADELKSKNVEAQYDAIKELIAVSTLTSGAGSFEKGEVGFTELPIYQAGYTTSSAPKYQQYAIIELGGQNGYSVNKTPIVFSLPVKNADDEWQYSETYSYINGAIKNPSTAGPGVRGILVTGFAIIAFSGALLLAYVLYFRKKSYAPSHLKK